MTITKLIQILKNDEQLAALLGGNHVYATPCTYRGNCITYNWLPVTSDKIKTTDKLEMHIITDTILDSVAVEERVKELLLTLGDEPLSGEIRDVYLNGGGNLFDEERQKNHRILYFYILVKE